MSKSKPEMGSKTFGIVGLVSQLKSKQINREAEMQRSYVWGNKEQTEYLDSLFQSDYTYIPQIIGAETEVEIEIKGKIEKVMDLLDGNQRTTTIELFLDNKIKLGYNIRPVIIEQEDGIEKEYNLVGMTWNEIPEEVKTYFKANRINMVYWKNMNYEERERQFLKLQGGKKLTNAEINKVRIGQKIREFIYKQLATDLWTKYINISSNREVKFETMQQILMIISSKCDLSGNSLRLFSEDSEMITEDILDQVEQATEYLDQVVKLIKKLSLPIELQGLEESEIIENLKPKEIKKYLKTIEYLKKVNVPIIYNTVLKAIQNNVNTDQFVEFLNNFFLDIPFDYHSKMGDGSASATNVKIRIDSMTKEFMNHFKIEEEPEVLNQEQNQDSQNQEPLSDEEKEATNNIYDIINQNKAS